MSPGSKIPHPIDTRLARKALLVGIRYSQKIEAKGTYTDVDRVYRLLVDVFGYKPNDIKVMKDDGSDPSTNPTRENLLKAIDNLIRGAKQGDHFVFHFSGHGSQQREATPNSEKDHKDEAIWPSDVYFKPDPSNIILDNKIRERLVNPLPERVNLVIIFDCCHSGTAADLEHGHTDHYTGRVEKMELASIVYRQTKFEAVQAPSGPFADGRSPTSPTTPGGPERMGSKAKIVSWAACRDSQLALSDKIQGGMFINSLTHAIRELLKCYKGHQDEITHEKILHLVTANLDYQITCTRISLHGQEKASDKPAHKHRPYHWYVKKVTAPRPQLGTSHDYDLILRSPALRMFGYPL